MVKKYINEYDYDEDIEFVIMTNEILNNEFKDNNTICIYSRLERPQILKWSIEAIRFPNYVYRTHDVNLYDMEKSHYDGYRSTFDIWHSIKHKFTIPAIGYAISKSTNEGMGYQSYLPAFGQLMFISKKLQKLQEIFKNLGCENINDYLPWCRLYKRYDLEGIWWSSTVDGEDINGSNTKIDCLSNGNFFSFDMKNKGKILCLYKINN